MLFNFSVAVDDALLDEWDPWAASSGCKAGVGGGSKVDDGSLGVGAAPGPGCLKIPKLIDFLSGLILQDIVCSAFTFTQRTRYDFPSTSVNVNRLAHESYLAMYLELLHTRHFD